MSLLKKLPCFALASALSTRAKVTATRISLEPNISENLQYFLLMIMGLKNALFLPRQLACPRSATHCPPRPVQQGFYRLWRQHCQVKRKTVLKHNWSQTSFPRDIFLSITSKNESDLGDARFRSIFNPRSLERGHGITQIVG